MPVILFILLIFGTVSTAFIFRRVYFNASVGRPDTPILSNPCHGRKKYKFLIVLGSGGHTTEMLRLITSLIPRMGDIEFVFLVAATDSISLLRIPSILGDDFTYRVLKMKRIREVGEPVYTALLRAPFIFISALQVVSRESADVILCNGPGTCLPVVYASIFLELLFLGARTVRIFAESFCRVKTISVTGRLLYPFMDSFILQWPPTDEIKRRYPRAKYLGSLL